MNLGILGLDEITGKIVDGSVVLIECHTGLCNHLLVKIAKENEDLAIFAHKRMEKLFSRNVFYPNDVYNLHQLYTIPLAIKKCKQKMVLFLLLHDLFSIHMPESVCGLFSEIAGIVRNQKKVLVSSIDTDLIDVKTLSMLENEADYVIELREEVNGLKIRRGIRAKKSLTKPPSDFYDFDLDEFKIGKRLKR